MSAVSQLCQLASVCVSYLPFVSCVSAISRLCHLCQLAPVCVRCVSWPTKPSCCCWSLTPTAAASWTGSWTSATLLCPVWEMTASMPSQPYSPPGEPCSPPGEPYSPPGFLTSLFTLYHFSLVNIYDSQAQGLSAGSVDRDNEKL